jgi:hypothetical protein
MYMLCIFFPTNINAHRHKCTLNTRLYKSTNHAIYMHLRLDLMYDDKF